tara:strand:+ start:7101 stop:7271 length:171 start_codon:yes stop_codon:yes gene_type:complete
MMIKPFTSRFLQIRKMLSRFSLTKSSLVKQYKEATFKDSMDTKYQLHKEFSSKLND